MANFKTFTNASAPYEGKKIAIDTDRVSCFYEDVLKADEGKHTTICKKKMYGPCKKILQLLKKILAANQEKLNNDTRNII